MKLPQNKKNKKKKKILGKKPNNDWEGRLAVDNQTFFFSCLMDQNSQNIVLTNNSRTAWRSYSNSYVIFEILWQFYRCILFFKSEWSGSRLAVDNQTFFFFFFGLMDIGRLAVVAFWRSPHGPLGSGPPRAGYSQKKKKKKKKRKEKGRFNIFAMAGLRTQSAPAYMDQNSQNIVLINSRTAWPRVYLNSNTIFEILGQFTIRCIRYIIFQKGVDNSEIKHKTYLF